MIRYDFTGIFQDQTSDEFYKVIDIWSPYAIQLVIKDLINIAGILIVLESQIQYHQFLLSKGRHIIISIMVFRIFL